MFTENPEGAFPSPNTDRFSLGEICPHVEKPDPTLLSLIGWRSDQYDFDFFEADVMDDNFPSSSWVEFAFSRQLGGAFVIWLSGVSALDARHVNYGWVEGADPESIPHAIETKAKTRGPQLLGLRTDTSKYYEMINATGQANTH